MSADNFITIRKHPAGGFTPVMGFASYDGPEEDYPQAEEYHASYVTLQEALDVAHEETFLEYGISIHPECGAATVEFAHLEAAMRMLIDSGDMTPMAKRVIRSIFVGDSDA